MNDKVVQIFAETLHVDPSRISDATSPDNTPQWNSLTTLKLAMAISEAFSVKLTNAEVLSMRNVGLVRSVLRRKGLFHHLADHSCGRLPIGAPIPAHTRSRPTAPARRHSPCGQRAVFDKFKNATG